MSTPTFDFSWLSEVLDKLQSLPVETQRPTIFQILRYQRKEHAYSNMLAYFLDKEADHGLQTLFLQSLIGCVFSRDVAWAEEAKLDQNQWIEKIEYTSYTVLRESMNIDLLIQSEPESTKEKEVSLQQEWAIIIENKIDHHLHNPLKSYWESIDSENKIGIVLAPTDLQFEVEQKLSHKSSNEIHFVAITYEMLQKQVLQHLPEFLLKADERGISLCMDFLTTIERMNPQIQSKLPIMEDNIRNYRKHKGEIDQLLSHIGEMKEYLIRLINEHMEKLGFTQYSNKVGASRKYYPGEELYEGLGIYVEFDTLLNYEKLHMAFELIRGHTNLIDVLREKLQAANVFSEQISASTEAAKSSHAHIFWLEADLSNKDVKDGLDEWFGYIGSVVSKTLEILPTIREKV